MFQVKGVDKRSDLCVGLCDNVISESKSHAKHGLLYGCSLVWIDGILRIN